MERQVEKGQDGFVLFFRIYLHELRTVPWAFFRYCEYCTYCDSVLGSM